jgi:hypothetical protein
MRAGARRAALEVALEARFEVGEGQRVGLVGKTGLGQPEQAGMLGEPGLEELDELSAGDVEPGAERGYVLRPRLDGCPVGDPRAGPAQRFVPLRESAAVLAGKRRPRRKDAPEHAIHVGTADRGATLDHREPVRDEHERGQPQAEILGRVEHGAVQPDPLSLARRDRDLGVDRGTGLGALEPNPGGLVAKAYEARL